MPPKKKTDDGGRVSALSPQQLAAQGFSPSEICRRTHFQNCSACDRADCGDNLTPSVVALRAELAEARSARDEAVAVRDSLYGRVEELEERLRVSGLMREWKEQTERLLAPFALTVEGVQSLREELAKAEQRSAYRRDQVLRLQRERAALRSELAHALRSRLAELTGES